jgi:hypothetical protein
MISTYGVGAMIAVGEQSYVISEVDHWRVPAGGPDLHEYRLESRLGVSGFQRPPFVQDDDSYGVPVRLFPEWYTCTGCRQNLKSYRKFDPTKANRCGACDEALTPSRFVVACENGHLDDFPYWAWVHKGGEPTSSEHQLHYQASGRSSSLRSILIGCTCGKRVSMDGAFGEKALVRLGIACSGGRLWISSRSQVAGCQAPPRTLQRGSSSAWFSLQQSALSIPPFSQQVHKIISPFVSQWINESDELIARLAEKAAVVKGGVLVEDVIAAVRDHERYLAGDAAAIAPITGFSAADALRLEEYRQLSRPAQTADFVCAVPPGDSSVRPPAGFLQPMAVTRLREVRALCRFTRVHPPMDDEPEERLVPVGSGGVDWLPAIEVLGEGVFLRLDVDALSAWEAQTGPDSPIVRAGRIAENHELVLAERAKPRRPVPGSRITARYVLVHTLAHALLNEWALDASYPAASMRERLYVSDEMAGFLIYTATSDSAGSLGGLVAKARPERIAASLEAALQRIAWCSADPLCMESDASGADSLNLAACHACVLLPETSCEANNAFLDRAMLIGAAPDRPGFFPFRGPDSHR